MTLVPEASFTQPHPLKLALSGFWTARGIGTIEHRLDRVHIPSHSDAVADATKIEALDTAGAWLLQRLIQRLVRDGTALHLHNLHPMFEKLMAVVHHQVITQHKEPDASKKATQSRLEQLGRKAVENCEQGIALMGFVGEIAVTLTRNLRSPLRFRWRPMLYNIRSAGFDALPIVGLLSFLLGIVVAYQGADQLRQYGANIFVVDLIGLSMLREFAPLITAIIVAGRSGSAYAAQIGTMAVTEEIDAMRTLGIVPMEMLVLPKLFALLIALPLLTIFADLSGVTGGMLMARIQLDVGFIEFLDRFAKAISVTAYLIGIGKAIVFAAIIVVVGCFQGFRTKGGADSVGRQTTRSVVQSIFLVIVADALFSVAFSVLDL